MMVARNFRSPNRRGEIDLIGWHNDILCFVEVKTRTTHDVKPAEAAVDREKRHDLLAVAREYLRHMPPSCQWRLEVISVYYDQQSSRPQIELFRNVPNLGVKYLVCCDCLRRKDWDCLSLEKTRL